MRDVWVEFDDGVGRRRGRRLRGLSLECRPARRVALLGRNGAGKSTLLRVAAGVIEPDRGSVRADGRGGAAAADARRLPAARARGRRAAADAAAAALHELGLDGFEERDPRDLSGGERQRLALGIVLAGRGIGGGDPPAVVALDEPTRGMDQARKRDLAERLRRLAAAGAAIVVATHDIEFAARVSRRCVLLGSGRVVADGATREVLSGGRYFTTEVARVLGPEAGVVLAEEGAAALAPPRPAKLPDSIVSA